MQELNIRSQEELQKKKRQLDIKFKQLENMTVEKILEELGYQFINELESSPMIRYTIAMANSGPNTNGSQFFINLVDNPHLNGKHTVFGKMLKGRDVPDKIVALPAKNDKPEKDIIIKKIELLK